MAEILKREYDIVVLKVELCAGSRDETGVRFTLQCKVDGQLAQIWSITEELRTLEMNDSRAERGKRRARLQATLPASVLEALTNWYAENRETPPPLWVHLVAPYGVLRFVPWERILGQALEVPILMLPDFIFPPPREAAEVLQVAICASAPLGCEEAWIQETLQQTVDRILESKARRIQIHVFTDAQSLPSLERRWGMRQWLGNKVILHSHETARRFVAPEVASRRIDTSGQLRSPWLLWMREALQHQTIDVVHFICHGYLSRDNGAILFAQSPLERTERFLAGPVAYPELQTFLTQIGAWSCVFSSVMDNFSEIGLRALADEVAQNRPGPMMVHDCSLDPEGHALVDAYKYLYSDTRPQAPPRSTAIFVYSQPYLALRPAGARPRREGRRLRSGAETALGEQSRNSLQAKSIAALQPASASLEALFAGQENCAPAVAATERFAEQVELRYQKLARDGIIPDDTGERLSLAVTDILGRLREAVATEVQTRVPAGEMTRPEAGRAEGTA